MSIARTWGTGPEERQLSYPCDGFMPHPDDSLYRGVTIDASHQIVFRWLCQMRVAPYSYDWIDNLGRQSRRPDSRTRRPAVGQNLMEIFQLADFRSRPASHATDES